ncbi:hypothetical protein KJI95_06005 [Shewanella sp. JM162201]|uniref:YXWGXW repeat-containing protein n=1 Tax=Shewanella jiangmenensis TaxID=2837387 RepID=A0ABS5V365_9GAMM|nr:hypothetical protein [Shewanella jiangmenensis]MBT1444076.1 hypothetical protein [Shewanella jiangmenensis]
MKLVSSLGLTLSVTVAAATFFTAAFSATEVSAAERLGSTVWVGNENGLGLSYSTGGYAGNQVGASWHHNNWPSGWRPGLNWGGHWNSPWYGPWRDPFYRDPFYRDPFWRYNDNRYWQQREWERDREREREAAQAERQRRLTQPRLVEPVPPAQITRSQSQSQPGSLASLPDNARVIMVNGKPRYEWQGQLYRLDWETQRYVPDAASDSAASGSNPPASNPPAKK